MSGISSELYFLIAKFLAGGPCQKAAEVLVEELEKHEIIPKSVNWLGETFTQDYQTFVSALDPKMTQSSKFSHIGSEQLLKLLEHLLSSINSKDSSGVSGVKSLLSCRTTSLLQKSITSPCRPNSIRHLLNRRNGHVLPLTSENVTPPNFATAILGRELSGTGVTPELVRPDFYSRLKLSCRTLGHLSAVYCVLFDVSGKFVFTGADDKLVKVWSAVDGRLLATLRGSHADSAEITDLAVNYENTLLAASSCDKVIRIWCLRTGAPISVLTGHGGTVTSIFFCPVPSSFSPVRYLGSTSTDGCCAFWAYTEEPGQPAQFQAKPTLYQERMRPGHAQMICSSFSSGGVFMAAGSADFNVRVYYMLGQEGPERILEVEVHSDRVDSISWSHRGVRFISGSKDGTALVWRWEHQQWRYVRILCSKPSHGDPPAAADSRQRPRVTMVGWNADDSMVLTAISNNLVKVWNPRNGNLVRVLRDHRGEAYVIETHPTNPRIVCTAAHDGNIFIWDIGDLSNPDVESGKKLFEYHNELPDGQGYGAIFDVKWSPDGLCLVATDSHGNLMIFNCTENSKFAELPKELFFHTDYRPLVMDAMTHEVLDEQTQVAPHLMPPPFLVDVDGNPYPPKLQRLVPGRESCKDDQLIPNVAVAPTGFQEVIEGLPVFPGGPQPAPAPLPPSALNPRSNIDQMIEQLAAAQGVRVENLNGGTRRSGGNRRSGDVEGVRQSRGNWQTTGFYRYFKRSVIPPLNPSLLARSEEIRHALAVEEDEYFQEHKTKKPPVSSSSPGISVSPTSLTSREIRSRRVRRLAAQAAERRRQQEMNQIDEQEGIARPNPPQQEISLPQERNMTPRRPPRARPAATASRARRRVRYTVPRSFRESDQEAAQSLGESDSEFSSSDVSGASSSDSDSSESDWGATPTGTPKKGTATTSTNNRRRTARRSSNANSPSEPLNGNATDQDYEEPRPGPSSQVSKPIKSEPQVVRPRRVVSKKKRAVVEVGGLEEIDEKYRPSEWLSEVMPRRTPYYPQLGDDLVYFRQGHAMYVAEVEANGIYTLSKKDLKNLPWKLNSDLPTEIPVRVIGIKFELKPPRLVSLKLAVTDWDTGEMTGQNINNVVYHDVSDVVDFLVIRQHYDRSMRHNWNVNDRFRCLIEKEWWLGTIEKKEALHAEFPESKFMCYKAIWDNKDRERMSPWDLEIITDDFEIPQGWTKGDGIPASEADLRSGMYEVNERDWPPHGHQDAECIRIRSMLENVMTLAIAEPFLTPVDLNAYPMYAYEVEYPVDLSTIKSRLENHFYRRLDAVKFDIKLIAQNTEKFNQPGSEIVKQARIIRDICLRVMSQPGATEVTSVYHNLVKNFTWGDSEGESREVSERRKSRVSGLRQSRNTRAEPVQGPSSSTNHRTSTRLQQKEIFKVRRKGHLADSDESNKSWQERCKDLLNTLWASKDSTPFREPVDPIEYPDYHKQIDTPMDLQSVREDLLGNNYDSPQEFAKDMQLIFINSRIYNTDRHSAIHIMTVRLQAVFESQIKPILDDYKYQRRRGGRSSESRTNRKFSSRNGIAQRNGASGSSRSTRNEVPENSRNGSGPSTPRKNPLRSAAMKNPFVPNEQAYESSSEPEADEENYRDTRRRRKRRVSEQQSPSTSTAKKRRILNGQGQNGPQPGSSRPVKRLRLDNVSISTDTHAVEMEGSQPRGGRGGNRNAKNIKVEVKSEESDLEENEEQMPNLKRADSEYEESSANEEDEEPEYGLRTRAPLASQRTLRNRSHTNRAYSDTEHSDEAGPNTRYRGRPVKNYDESRAELSEESEKSADLTLADRVKKFHRGNIRNGYNNHLHAGGSDENNVHDEEQPGPSSRQNKVNSRYKTRRRAIVSDEEDEHNEELAQSSLNSRRNRSQRVSRNSRKLHSDSEEDKELSDHTDEEDQETSMHPRKGGRRPAKRTTKGRGNKESSSEHDDEGGEDESSPRSGVRHSRRVTAGKRATRMNDEEFDEEDLHEESEEEDENDEEYSLHRTRRKLSKSARKQKKNRSRVSSDDDSGSASPRRSTPSRSPMKSRWNQSNEMPVRRQTRRGVAKPDYAEGSSEDEHSVSVSSRGRIRRRKSFLGE